MKWEKSIQYIVPGFRLTTFGIWVSSHNHLTRAPARPPLYLTFVIDVGDLLHNELEVVVERQAFVRLLKKHYKIKCINFDYNQVKRFDNHSSR